MRKALTSITGFLLGALLSFGLTQTAFAQAAIDQLTAFTFSSGTAGPRRVLLFANTTTGPACLADLTVFTDTPDVTGGVQLMAGNGNYCEQNTQRVTVVHPLSIARELVFSNRPVPAGKSLCLYVTGQIHATGDGSYQILGQ
jgi:hypothetical protein